MTEQQYTGADRVAWMNHEARQMYTAWGTALIATVLASDLDVRLARSIQDRPPDWSMLDAFADELRQESDLRVLLATTGDHSSLYPESDNIEIFTSALSYIDEPIEIPDSAAVFHAIDSFVFGMVFTIEAAADIAGERSSVAALIEGMREVLDNPSIGPLLEEYAIAPFAFYQTGLVDKARLGFSPDQKIGVAGPDNVLVPHMELLKIIRDALTLQNRQGLELANDEQLAIDPESDEVSYGELRHLAAFKSVGCPVAKAPVAGELSLISLMPPFISELLDRIQRQLET